jgi:hypothetical protein
MATLTTEQMAELLVGIARAQQAIVDAVESARPGFKATHLAPLLYTAARTRNTGYTPGLADLPARILIACQSRTGPDAPTVLRDLEEILARTHKLGE